MKNIRLLKGTVINCYCYSGGANPITSLALMKLALLHVNAIASYALCISDQKMTSAIPFLTVIVIALAPSLI